MSIDFSELEEVSYALKPGFSDKDSWPEDKNENFSTSIKNYSTIYHSPEYQNKHSKLKQMTTQLSMQLEDFRSHLFRIESKERYSLAMSEYLDTFINELHESVNTNETSQKYNYSSSLTQNSNIDTVVRISDYFFSQLSIIDTMEEKYKENIDNSYKSDKNKEFLLKKKFLDEEIENLLIEKKKLQAEILTHKAKNKILDETIYKSKEAEKLLTDLYKEKELEFKKIREQNDLLREKIKSYDRLCKNLEKLQIDHNIRDTERNRGGVNMHKEEINDDGFDFSGKIIQKIKSQLLNNTPFQVAEHILKKIKDSIKSKENLETIDTFEKSMQICELKQKKELLDKYINSEKKKIEQEKLRLSKEFKLLDFFKRTLNEKCDNESIKKSIDKLLKEKQMIQKEKEIIAQVMTTIECLEENIKVSIRNYKQTYKEMYGIYYKLDNLIKEIRFLFGNFPSLIGELENIGRGSSII